MINNHKKSIVVVISSSDLVLAGLAEILKGSLANEVITLHRGDEMIDYPKMDGNVLVLSTSEEYEKSNTFIRQILQSAGHLQFLTLQLDPQAGYSGHTIHLNDTAHMLQGERGA